LSILLLSEPGPRLPEKSNQRTVTKLNKFMSAYTNTAQLKRCVGKKTKIHWLLFNGNEIHI